MSNWGKGVANNNIGWGQSATNNDIDYGISYFTSYSGDTLLIDTYIVLVRDYNNRIEQDGGVLQTNETLTRDTLSQLICI